jgi:hypothetical protein
MWAGSRSPAQPTHTAHFMWRSRFPTSVTSIKVEPLAQRFIDRSTSCNSIGPAPLAFMSRRSISSVAIVTGWPIGVAQSSSRQRIDQPERCRKLTRMRTTISLPWGLLQHQTPVSNSASVSSNARASSPPDRAPLSFGFMVNFDKVSLNPQAVQTSTQVVGTLS